MGIKYKIRNFSGGWDILNVESKISIPRDSDNRYYQQFVDDIHMNGIEIVEGADYVGVTSYAEARREEYPPLEDQLDKIYHSGVDAWKADIKAIKDKYPKTQVGITSIAPIPEWVNTTLFNRQKEEYIKATARLAQYELASGLLNADGIKFDIAPLPIYKDGVRNPEVVRD